MPGKRAQSKTLTSAIAATRFAKKLGRQHAEDGSAPYRTVLQPAEDEIYSKFHVDVAPIYDAAYRKAASTRQARRFAESGQSPGDWLRAALARYHQLDSYWAGYKVERQELHTLSPSGWTQMGQSPATLRFLAEKDHAEDFRWADALMALAFALEQLPMPEVLIWLPDEDTLPDAVRRASGPARAQAEQATLVGHWPRWLQPVQAPGIGANLREVAPDLWVGAQPAVLPAKHAPAWDTVVNLRVAPEDRDNEPHDEASSKYVKAYARARKVYSLPFDDGEPPPDWVLEDALAAWRARRGPVLIHCHWGLSRSASIAAVILLVDLGLSEAEARRRVKTPGAIGWPRGETLEPAIAWAHAELANDHGDD
jgi:protein-tyrosine phosphatase